MQSYQEKRQGNGYLFQEQEPQAETGLVDLAAQKQPVFVQKSAYISKIIADFIR